MLRILQMMMCAQVWCVFSSLLTLRKILNAVILYVYLVNRTKVLLFIFDWDDQTKVFVCKL